MKIQFTSIASRKVMQLVGGGGIVEDIRYSVKMPDGEIAIVNHLGRVTWLHSPAAAAKMLREAGQVGIKDVDGLAP